MHGDIPPLLHAHSWCGGWYSLDSLTFYAYICNKGQLDPSALSHCIVLIFKGQYLDIQTLWRWHYTSSKCQDPITIHMALYSRRKKSAHHYQNLKTHLSKVAQWFFWIDILLLQCYQEWRHGVLHLAVEFWLTHVILYKLLHLLRHIFFRLVLLVRRDMLWYLQCVTGVVEVQQWCICVLPCIL